jgi:hypothetical protein
MEFTRIASEAEVEGRMSERSIFRNQLSLRTGLLCVLPISVCSRGSVLHTLREERAYEEKKDA